MSAVIVPLFSRPHLETIRQQVAGYGWYVRILNPHRPPASFVITDRHGTEVLYGRMTWFDTGASGESRAYRAIRNRSRVMRKLGLAVIAFGLLAGSAMPAFSAQRDSDRNTSEDLRWLRGKRKPECISMPMRWEMASIDS